MIHLQANTKEFRREMSTNNETDVSLAFSWINRKEKDLMIKFPELFIVDVTENTNVKKGDYSCPLELMGMGKCTLVLNVP